MFTGKHHIGKPIISASNGRKLGTLKDLYVDRELTQVVGVFMGLDGLFSRQELCVERSNVLVFGIDAILVKADDVVVDGVPACESGNRLRRDQLPGRQIVTAGGTMVGNVDDIILDEETRIVGFRLGRVYVKGPVAENRAIVREAIIDVGGEGGMIVDLGVAERQSLTAE